MNWTTSGSRGEFLNCLGIGTIAFACLFGWGYIEIGPVTRNVRLNLAAIRGDLREARTMLARGAKADTTEFGGTPLSWAAYNGDVEMMKLLIAAGASLTLESDMGFSPMGSAVQQGRIACIELLLKQGVDINRRYRNGGTALMSTVPTTPEDDVHLGVVRYLLKRGADPNIRDDLGLTALHWLVHCDRGTPQRLCECVRALIAAGADVNARTMRNKGRTALHHAAVGGRVELVTVLLAAGADRSLHDQEGRTAYDLAVTEKQTALLPLLR